MRNYVLTDKERKILQSWIRDGDEQPGYHTLKTRIIHNFFALSEDVKLITNYIIKIEDSLTADSRLKTSNIKTWILEYLSLAAPDNIPQVKEISEHLDNYSMLLASAMENSPEAVIIFDANFSVIYVNDAFLDLTGWLRESIMDKLTTDFYNGFTYDAIVAKLKAEGCLKGEVPFRFGGPGGEPRWIEFTASAVKRDDVAVAYVSFIRDVSDRKALENELVNLVKKLNRSTES
jgi:PAS domain S-box-containing protein